MCRLFARTRLMPSRSQRSNPRGISRDQRNLTVIFGSPAAGSLLTVGSFLLMKRHLDCVPDLLQRPPQYRIPPMCAFIAWASTSFCNRVTTHLFGPGALDEVRTH